MAVVTGAGGTDMGDGIALAFAGEGAAVLVANQPPEAGTDTARRIAAGGRARFQPTDVTREEDCAGAITAALEHFGRLDVLVNNAAVFPRHPRGDHGRGSGRRS